MKLTLKELDKESCLSWHKFCGAECCKEFSLYLPKGNPREWVKGRLLKVGLEGLSSDYKRYLLLHGALLGDDCLAFKLKDFKKKGHHITIYSRCRALNSDLRCGIYPDRPFVCRKVNDVDIRSGLDGVYLTNNCLFKRKKEAIENEY